MWHSLPDFAAMGREAGQDDTESARGNERADPARARPAREARRRPDASTTVRGSCRGDEVEPAGEDPDAPGSGGAAQAELLHVLEGAPDQGGGLVAVGTLGDPDL